MNLYHLKRRRTVIKRVLSRKCKPCDANLESFSVDVVDLHLDEVSLAEHRLQAHRLALDVQLVGGLSVVRPRFHHRHQLNFALSERIRRRIRRREVLGLLLLDQHALVEQFLGELTSLLLLLEHLAADLPGVVVVVVLDADDVLGVADDPEPRDGGVREPRDRRFDRRYGGGGGRRFDGVADASFARQTLELRLPRRHGGGSSRRRGSRALLLESIA